MRTLEIAKAVIFCKRMYFGMSASAPYLEHFLAMAKMRAANRYDRLTHDVEAILGRPATSLRDFVARHAESFAP